MERLKAQLCGRCVPYSLGRIAFTSNAEAMLSPDDVMEALWRHAEGDWGDVDEDDLISNKLAFEEETHLLSVYHAATGQEFWIITKYDYSVTTVLLPEDY